MISDYKKKILLIEPNGTAFIRTYVEKVLQNTGYDICVLSIAGTSEKNLSWYAERGVSFISLMDLCGEVPSFKRISGVKGWIRCLREVRKLFPKIDFIHVHCILFSTLFPLILLNSSKLILTMWGSDVYTKSKAYIGLEGFAFRRANAIRCMSSGMLAEFNKKTDYKYKAKADVLDYGTRLIDVIERCENECSKKEAKLYWGMDSDLINIHIGYNGSSRQHHIDILNEIEKLDERLKKRIQLIIHFGYAVQSKEYRDSVINCLRAINVTSRFMDNYISEDKDIANFRRTCDIFIYGQDTDGMSCSCVEYLYAGALFIKPSWLDYTELENAGVEDIEYNQFSEISGILTDVIKNGRSVNIEKQRQVIQQLKSWDVLAPRWRLLYEK